jgi:hypothetical protein
VSFLAARFHQWHEGPIKALAARDDRLATGGADGTVHVMTLAGDRMGTSRVDTPVNGVAISVDGRVAIAAKDGSVRVFDPGVRRTYTVGDHDHWVMAVAWSDDGRWIASGSEDGTIGLWEPDGPGVRRVDLGRPVNSIDWRGDLIAAASGDRKVYLTDGYGSVRGILDGATQMLWSVRISPGGEQVAWVGRDRHLRIGRTDGEEPVVVPAHTSQVWGVAWHPDGRRIATASADGTVAVWTSSGIPIERVSIGSWARAAELRGETLFVATETGNLAAYDEDHLEPRRPGAVSVPEPPDTCLHWDPVFLETAKRRCEECEATRELRLCVTCGHVGCCESQLAHATKHWEATGHPNTVPVGDAPFHWRWCYADDMYVKR